MPMTKRKLKKFIQELLDDETNLLMADGFEDAFVGVASQFTHPPVAVYDRAKCIQILMARDKMDHESAEEFFQFNVEGAWVGEQTPMFLVRLPS
jgi:hypothetical protein